MPLPRRRRPPRPPPPSPEALRREALYRRREAWRDAVRKESWRLTYAEGRRSCGAAEFARGEQSLLDQGFKPGPGVTLFEP